MTTFRQGKIPICDSVLLSIVTGKQQYDNPLQIATLVLYNRKSMLQFIFESR